MDRGEVDGSDARRPGAFEAAKSCRRPRAQCSRIEYPRNPRSPREGRLLGGSPGSAHKLLPSVAQTPEDFNLGRISPHQPSRRRSELRCKGDVHLGENRHRGYVTSGHLDGERCLNFVLRRRGFDHRERSIHREFGNPSPRGTIRRLYLEQRSVHEITRRCAESFVQPSPPIYAIAVRGIAELLSLAGLGCPCRIGIAERLSSAGCVCAAFYNLACRSASVTKALVCCLVQGGEILCRHTGLFRQTADALGGGVGLLFQIA